MIYEEVTDLTVKKFERDDRQNPIQSKLCNLNLDKFMADEEVTDLDKSLRSLVDEVTRLNF